MVGRLQIWDGRCAIFEPVEVGYEKRNRQHLISIAEFVEVVQIISQKHLCVQCNCLIVTFSSIRVAP